MQLQQLENESTVATYLQQVREGLKDLPAEEQDRLLMQVRARIELESELSPGRSAGETLRQLGGAAELARQLRGPVAEATQEQAADTHLASCRVCARDVSTEAYMCPHCGAPFPTRKNGCATGYEWKSPITVRGLPLVHIAYGRDKNGKVRVAKGIVAIGQFGVGVVTIAQCGVGAVFGLGQAVVAPIAIGQLALGLAALGQFGFGLLFGLGMIATGIIKAIGMLTFGNWF